MEISPLLKALGDDSRLRLIHLLSQGSFNVQELTNSLSLSQSTISHHLKILEQVGLVRFRKEGSWTFYTLADAEPDSIEGQLLSLTTSAVTRSARLVEQLEDDKQAIERIFATRRDKAKQYFDTVAKDWNSIRDQAQGSADYVPILRDLIPAEASLLEVGCGSGMLLKQLTPRNGETFGVDYSEAMIQEAKENLVGLHTEDPKSQIDLRLGYLEHLPIGDDTIDCALACMVFHHIAEPTKALQDIGRVLRPGGKLIVVDLVEHTDERMRERYADLWLGFNPKTFKSWAKQTGFSNFSMNILGPKKDVFLFEAQVCPS